LQGVHAGRWRGAPLARVARFVPRLAPAAPPITTTRTPIWPEPGALAEVADMADDGAEVDPSGLSCRWAPLQSRHCKMLTLIIQGVDAPARCSPTSCRGRGCT
jgi:hypothetical protein